LLGLAVANSLHKGLGPLIDTRLSGGLQPGFRDQALHHFGLVGMVLAINRVTLRIARRGCRNQKVMDLLVVHGIYSPAGEFSAVRCGTATSVRLGAMALPV
jgi:hypothetical protein